MRPLDELRELGLRVAATDWQEWLKQADEPSDVAARIPLVLAIGRSGLVDAPPGFFDRIRQASVGRKVLVLLLSLAPSDRELPSEIEQWPWADLRGAPDIPEALVPLELGIREGRIPDKNDPRIEKRRRRRRLAADAKEWLDNNKNDDFLWGGSQLSSYDSWLKEIEGELKPIEREFLDASHLARDEAAAAVQLAQAKETAAKAQERWDQAESRLAQAEQRLNEAHKAEAAASERSKSAEERRTAAEERLVLAEQRAHEASKVEIAASERLKAAHEQRAAAEQRLSDAEHRFKAKRVEAVANERTHAFRKQARFLFAGAAVVVVFLAAVMIWSFLRLQDAQDELRVAESALARRGEIERIAQYLAAESQILLAGRPRARNFVGRRIHEAVASRRRQPERRSDGGAAKCACGGIRPAVARA